MHVVEIVRLHQVDWAGRGGFFLTKSKLLSRAASPAGSGLRAGEEIRGGAGAPGVALVGGRCVDPRLREAVGARGGSKFSTRGLLIGSSLFGSSLKRSLATDVLVVEGLSSRCFGSPDRSAMCGRAPGIGDASGDASSRALFALVRMPFEAGIRGPSTTLLD